MIAIRPGEEDVGPAIAIEVSDGRREAGELRW